MQTATNNPATHAAVQAAIHALEQTRETVWEDAADLIIHEAAEAGLTPAELLDLVRAGLRRPQLTPDRDPHG